LASAAIGRSYETHRTRRRELPMVTLAQQAAVLDIKHSLRWHDPGRFNGYVLSQHFAGTPVDPINLQDALRGVNERAAGPALGALRSLALRVAPSRGPCPPIPVMDDRASCSAPSRGWVLGAIQTIMQTLHTAISGSRSGNSQRGRRRYLRSGSSGNFWDVGANLARGLTSAFSLLISATVCSALPADRRVRRTSVGGLP
jgi:hypothetical protein